MNETEIIERLVGVENRSRSNTHRLDRLENLTESVSSLANSVALMAQAQESMDKKLDEACADVKALKEIPTDNWKEAKKAIINLLIGALLGLVLTSLGLK